MIRPAPGCAPSAGLAMRSRDFPAVSMQSAGALNSDSALSMRVATRMDVVQNSHQFVKASRRHPYSTTTAWNQEVLFEGQALRRPPGVGDEQLDDFGSLRFVQTRLQCGKGRMQLSQLRKLVARLPSAKGLGCTHRIAHPSPRLFTRGESPQGVAPGGQRHPRRAAVQAPVPHGLRNR